MPTELQTTPLRRCLEKIIDYRGKTPKKLGSDWKNDGYRALSAINVKDSGLTSTETIRCVDSETYKKWMREEVRRGDILLTSEAPAGEVMIWESDEKIVLSQRLFCLRVNKQFNNRFIKYYLQSPTGKREVNRTRSGSTVAGISAEMFDQIQVVHPEKGRQKKIASVLSAIDAKIDLNQRINFELDALAKTIYDYWFVQFDFPDETGRPYKSSGGEMVWNEAMKREIPRGWKAQPLSAWIAKQKGGDWGTDAASGKNDAQVTCIRGADINALNGRGDLNAPTRYIPPSKAEKYLAPHDLVIEISGGSPTQSTGRAALVSPHVIERFNVPLVCSNFCKALTLKDATQAFLFLQQWNALYTAGVFFGWEGKTSGIKNLQFDSFVGDYRVPVPPAALSNCFHDLCSSLEQRKQRGLHENHELVQLRDWLLPLLMNGQVSVT
ncbi:restriction endonuclease subunit S [Arenimonas metalli]|uniref:restriction endonuclease subunit S n=1 Tax=Arenimonas metalli TaxID=948077 RepID=UPI00147001D0|nr:restriction endonuclease subunit S [Arenimonas metalli]